ncbi:TerC family protein [Aeoliella sp. ICT_H6.2]|uniref:TerC family protein n=1 Tax=Aeoliella straminimaris TaxID=2954799 RepID=A0A9X2FG31_9BACT|nr:TerC family protein [Aeoliella straminimaris]MCO6047392.1 TerC family protein [Aeoliella straminimaris]
MEELFTLQSLAALATLSILEIVLGIDNIVFLAILTGKLPEESQPKARVLGLLLAAVGRVVLLLAISWVITLDDYIVVTLPLDLPGVPAGTHELSPDEVAEANRGETPLSVKDLILITGGLFLLAKSTLEIGHDIEGGAHSSGPTPRKAFFAVLLQIVAIDMVFSLDSVLTAVGMVNPDEYQHYWAALTIMITAVMLAIIVMMVFSGPISKFVNNHPSVKMLALAFLILIGVVLVAEGLHSHVPRGYIYFSMGFSLFVEMLNLRASARREAAAAESAG